MKKILSILGKIIEVLRVIVVSILCTMIPLLGAVSLFGKIVTDWVFMFFLMDRLYGLFEDFAMQGVIGVVLYILQWFLFSGVLIFLYTLWVVTLEASETAMGWKGIVKSSSQVSILILVIHSLVIILLGGIAVTITSILKPLTESEVILLPLLISAVNAVVAIGALVVTGPVSGKILEWVSKEFLVEVRKDFYQTFQRKLACFWDNAVRDYGLESIYRKLQDGYLTYSFDKTKPEKYIYYKQAEDAYYSHSNLSPKWVTNEERVGVITDILAKVLPGYTVEQANKATMNHLDQLLGITQRSSARPACLYSKLENLEKTRSAEMSDYFMFRLKSYIDDYYATKIGLAGEEALRKGLDIHTGIVSLYGLRFQDLYNGTMRSCEIDAIVINEYGVFALEAKNYGQRGDFRIQIEADGSWYKVTKATNSGKEYRNLMENPVAQNDWHVAVLEKKIEEILGRKVPVRNIVVITNDNIDVRYAQSYNAKISRIGTVYGMISQYTSPMMTMQEVDMLREQLLVNSLPPQKFPIWDYSDEMIGMMRARKQLHLAIDNAFTAITKCRMDNPKIKLPET